MSFDGKGTCLQVLVLILELISVTTLGFSPWVHLWVGYTTLQCMLALVLPDKFSAGSCSASMSHSSDIGLLRSASWAVWDVLRFCCQMRRWWWGRGCSGCVFIRGVRRGVGFLAVVSGSEGVERWGGCQES